MLAPISWLKDYVDINLPLSDLMWKMTEVGLTTEKYNKVGHEIILDLEATPNRPDWLSIVGISREISAIENKKIKLPEIKEIPEKKTNLPILVKNNFELCSHYTAISIANVKVGPSPDWMQKRLKLVGLRPINNLVDITNYVMFELGNPIHVFDYDKFISPKIVLSLSKGGENFVSVDGISYKLPREAIVFKDQKGHVIDLCGIKGGENSGISENSKNIFIHVAVYEGKYIRRTSQKMGLSSEASYIFERGANKGGTIDSLKRVVSLVLELAGGEIASKIIDHSEKKFNPWKLSLSPKRLYKVLGIKIGKKDILNIFERLNLSPKFNKNTIICIIPTYRTDLKIEEDLIEEVARIWGYNKFPKTLPYGAVSQQIAPYYNDRKNEFELKNIMVGEGFSEVTTLSLTSADLIGKCQLNIENHIKIANPVSLDYEYLRTTLIANLLVAARDNKDKDVNIFEFSKVYLPAVRQVSKETYKMAAVAKNSNFRKIKGAVELLLEKLNISSFDIKPTIYSEGLWHPTKSGVIEIGGQELGFLGEIHPMALKNLGIKNPIFGFELNVALLEKSRKDIIFKPPPKYPSQIEDVTITFPPRTKIGEIVRLILKSDKLIAQVELKDIYQDSYTFRIWYQDPKKTLNGHEVKKIRDKILKKVKEKFGGVLKN